MGEAKRRPARHPGSHATPSHQDTERQPDVQRVVLLLLAAVALGFLVLIPLRRGQSAGPVDGLSSGESASSSESDVPDLSAGAGDAQATREPLASTRAATPVKEAEGLPSSRPSIMFDLPDRSGDCLLTGKLLDPAGRTVSNVWVESVGSDVVPRQHLPTDGFAIFTGSIPAAGEVTIVFSKINVGQSEPLEIVALEGITVDVGEVWLLEEGTLGGLVRLADGHPVPGVLVTATAASRQSLGGLSVSSAETGDDGRFTIAGVAEGEFAFHVAGDEPYPLLADVRAATHDTGVLLEVDALLLVTRCVQGDGEPVLIRRVNRSLRPGGSTQGSTSMGIFTKTPAAESIVVHAAVGHEYMLQAVAEDGLVYTAFVDASLTAGRHEIDLLAESEKLATVTLQGPKLGAFDAGLLQVTNLKLEGERMEVSARYSAFHPTVVSTILDGLPKGSYEVECTLATSGYEVLLDSVRRFELSPPKDKVLSFTTTLGGRLELSFTAAPGRRGWIQSVIQIKREGAPDASYTSFSGRPDPRQDFGGAIVAPGIPIGSRVFEPGRYEVRLECDGHLPKTVGVEVKPGATTKVEIALEADPGADPEAP